MNRSVAPELLPSDPGFWPRAAKEIAREFATRRKDFLRQPLITQTLHPACQGLSKACWEALRDNLFFKSVILNGLSESPVGNPYSFIEYPNLSPLTIQHAYYLNLLKAQLGIFLPIDMEHIVEIGGGYGNFCRLVKGFGYSGRYQIADLPQLSEIQRYYLKETIGVNGVEFLPLLPELLQPEPRSRSILLATFSLNEMPMEDRQCLEPYYKNYQYLFFAYNDRFGEVDNIAYFDRLRDDLAPFFEMTWFRLGLRRCWFLLCKRI